MINDPREAWRFKLPPKSQARPRSCMEDAEQDLEFLVGALREKKNNRTAKNANRKKDCCGWNSRNNIHANKFEATQRNIVDGSFEIQLTHHQFRLESWKPPIVYDGF